MLMSLRYTGMVTQPKLLTCSGVNHGPYVILSQFVATFIFFLNPAYTRIVRYWRMASSGACFFWIQAPSLEVKRLQLQLRLLKSWAFLNAHTFSGPVNRMFQQYMGGSCINTKSGVAKVYQESRYWDMENHSQIPIFYSPSHCRGGTR